MSATDLLVILGMALAVYAPKVIPLVLVSERHAERLKRWLVYVAPAVLGALVAPSIVLRPPTLELAAFAVAAIVAATTRRMLTAIAAGAITLVATNLVRP